MASFNSTLFYFCDFLLSLRRTDILNRNPVYPTVIELIRNYTLFFFLNFDLIKISLKTDLLRDIFKVEKLSIIFVNILVLHLS